MLKKTLTSGNKSQLIITLVGSVVGLTIFFSSLHYFFLLRTSSSDILNENTIIVQKKVTTSNIFGKAKTNFSAKEIKQTLQLPFVLKVKKIVSNNFDIYFETKEKSLPKFGTYAVIQAVENDAISTHIKSWKWTPQSEFVPILLPREMLIGLNTFMSAKGMPQISDEIIQSFPCEFSFSKSGKKERVNCRVVGFTQSVASIVVPESFLMYGSKHYANSELQTTQILIESAPDKFDQVAQLLKEKNWESRKNQMMIAQLKDGISSVFLGLFILSSLIILLCFIVLIQFVLLRIAENTQKIKTLIVIGYSPQSILSTFSNAIIFQFLLAVISSVLCYFLVQLILGNHIQQLGIEKQLFFSFPSIVGMILVTLIFVLCVRYFTMRRIRKIQTVK